MKSESELELLRQLEEPLNCECRNYPQDDTAALITMLDTPYYPPYVADGLHYHNCLEIGICVAGNGKIHLRESTLPFSTGSMIIAPSGVYHSQHNMGDPLTHWRYLVINEELLLRRLPDRYRQTILSFLDSIRRTGLFLESLSADSGIDYLVRLMFDMRRRDGIEAALDLELCTVLLLTLIAREEKHISIGELGEPSEEHRRQPIEPALSYVYEHYKEDIRVDAMARSCSMSESYFRKTFLRIMNQSPLEYVNRYRVHRSLNLLRTTSDSIQNIAIRTGFASIAAYNRNFKRYVGMSPTQWRSRHPLS
ncbi:MAG: AraC family transcriptional regulator [Clostridia bacterium]|nr:AraC family transcriptional regulator [Clostridia bacterium]